MNQTFIKKSRFPIGTTGNSLSSPHSAYFWATELVKFVELETYQSFLNEYLRIQHKQLENKTKVYKMRTLHTTFIIINHASG